VPAVLGDALRSSTCLCRANTTYGRRALPHDGLDDRRLSSTAWGRLLTTRALTLSLEMSPRRSSSTPDNRGLLTECHRASSLADFGDTTSSSMAWEGARRLRAVKHPASADQHDTPSSSTPLMVFSNRASSSTASARLFLLRVVKHRRHVCRTTWCRRARFFVAYDDSDVYSSTRLGSA